MHHIRQRYRSDCFPTCIAMIAGIPHKKALKIVHPKRKKGTGYATTIQQGMKALEELGFKISRHFRSDSSLLEVAVGIAGTSTKLHQISFFKNKKLTDIKKLAIISVQWRTGDKHRHVLIWDPVTQKVYDPGYKRALPHAIYERNMRSYYEITFKRNDKRTTKTSKRS